MVGLTEEFDRSMELFRSIFGLAVPTPIAHNVNPERQGPEYDIDADVRKALVKFRAADLDTYRRAREVFEKQTASRKA